MSWVLGVQELSGAGTWGVRTLGSKDPGVQGSQGAGTWGAKSLGVWGAGDAGTLECRDPGVQVPS